MSVIVGRPINDIPLNGFQYLLDKGKQKNMRFKNKQKAIEFLKKHGYQEWTDEQFDDYFLFKTTITILFTNDFNGHAINNPHVFIVEVDPPEDVEIDADYIRKFEISNRFSGGHWRATMENIGFPYSLLLQGTKEEYKDEYWDFEFELLSGNY